MKISRLELRKLRVPLGREIGDNNCCYDTFDLCTLAVHSDTGAIGWGFGEKVFQGQFAKPVSWKIDMPSAAAMQQVVTEKVEPAIIGQEAEVLLHEMPALPDVPDYIYNSLRMALWDLAGQAAGKPVYQLLGGSPEKNEVFTYSSPCGFPQPIEWLAPYFKQHVAEGFRAIKVKVGHDDIEWDINRLRTIREAVGPDVQISVDGNTAWDGPGTLRWIERTEKEGIGLHYVEDPIWPDDLDGYRLLAKESPLPIIGHDYIPVAEDLRPLLDTGAIKQLRVRDGIDYALAAAKLAEEYDLTMIQCNTWGEHSVHFAVSHPRVERMEFANLAWNDLYLEPVPVKAGVSRAPEAPGLGLVPDPEKLEAWNVEDES